MKTEIAKTSTIGAASKTLTFASDLDGVGYMFNEVLRPWYLKRGVPASAMPEPKTYALAENWTHLRGDNALLVRDMVQAFREGVLFHTGQAYEDALAANKAIRAAGHRFVFITARNLPGIEADAEKATAKWLDEAGFEYDDLILTHDKHLESFDLLYDDCPANVRTSLAYGKNAVLTPRSWNDGVTDLPMAPWEQMLSVLESPALPTKASVLAVA